MNFQLRLPHNLLRLTAVTNEYSFSGFDQTNEHADMVANQASENLKKKTSVDGPLIQWYQ